MAEHQQTVVDGAVNISGMTNTTAMATLSLTVVGLFAAALTAASYPSLQARRGPLTSAPRNSGWWTILTANGLRVEHTDGMATWAEFETDAPELAQAAARLWPGIVALDSNDPRPEAAPCFAISYVATVRRDGAPRLHPFCPILAGGRLFAAIPRSSPKGRDLRRDPRCVIHALPGPDDDELCIRATAVEWPTTRPERW
jgi:hypothetical protein